MAWHGMAWHGMSDKVLEPEKTTERNDSEKRKEKQEQNEKDNEKEKEKEKQKQKEKERRKKRKPAIPGIPGTSGTPGSPGSHARKSTPELDRILLRGFYFQNRTLWRHASATADAVGRRRYIYIYTLHTRIIYAYSILAVYT